MKPGPLIMELEINPAILDIVRSYALKMLNADLIVSPSTPNKTKAYNILKSISNHY